MDRTYEVTNLQGVPRFMAEPNSSTIPSPSRLNTSAGYYVLGIAPRGTWNLVLQM